MIWIEICRHRNPRSRRGLFEAPSLAHSADSIILEFLRRGKVPVIECHISMLKKETGASRQHIDGQIPEKSGSFREFRDTQPRLSDK